MSEDSDLDPVSKSFVSLMALVVAGFGLWCTVLAFVGGTVPLFGWKLKGSMGEGLLFLFVGEPIVVTVGYWISMLIAIPLAVIFQKR